MPRPLRSILAVLAGFLLMTGIVIVCTLVCVHAMHLKSSHPTPGYLSLNVAYSLAAALAGGWLTGALAPAKPLHHGLALAMLMALLSMLALIHPAPAQPYSYQLFLAVAPPFAALAGAWLTTRRTQT